MEMSHPILAKITAAKEEAKKKQQTAYPKAYWTQRDSLKLINWWLYCHCKSTDGKKEVLNEFHNGASGHLGVTKKLRPSLSSRKAHSSYIVATGLDFFLRDL